MTAPPSERPAELCTCPVCSQIRGTFRGASPEAGASPQSNVVIMKGNEHPEEWQCRCVTTTGGIDSTMCQVHRGEAGAQPSPQKCAYCRGVGGIRCECYEESMKRAQTWNAEIVQSAKLLLGPDGWSHVRAYFADQYLGVAGGQPPAPLKDARQALERLGVRKDENVDEWAQRLGTQLAAAGEAEYSQPPAAPPNAVDDILHRLQRDATDPDTRNELGKLIAAPGDVDSLIKNAASVSRGLEADGQIAFATVVNEMAAALQRQQQACDNWREAMGNLATLARTQAAELGELRKQRNQLQKQVTALHQLVVRIQHDEASIQVALECAEAEKGHLATALRSYYERHQTAEPKGRRTIKGECACAPCIVARRLLASTQPDTTRGEAARNE